MTVRKAPWCGNDAPHTHRANVPTGRHCYHSKAEILDRALGGQSAGNASSLRAPPRSCTRGDMGHPGSLVPQRMAKPSSLPCLLKAPFRADSWERGEVGRKLQIFGIAGCCGTEAHSTMRKAHELLHKREADYRKSPSRMKQCESDLGRALFTPQLKAGSRTVVCRRETTPYQPAGCAQRVRKP